MLEASHNNELPAIPGKRYFTIGEVSELCGVKPHVLRYWEQEFSQLKPVKRRGNRRYYQRHDVVLIREIRALLYDQGFTIGGARQQLGAPVVEAKSPEATLPEKNQSQKDLVRELVRELEDLRTLLN
jgi:DNA-binding transcriptional MerR regulator